LMSKWLYYKDSNCKFVGSNPIKPLNVRKNNWRVSAWFSKPCLLALSATLGVCT
jgi:hypothetical protein